jgi:hypothetical protein
MAHDKKREQAPRRSGLEARTDRLPQWRPRGCAGMSATSAMAALGAGSCTLYGPAVRCKPDVIDLEIIGPAHLYSAR